MCLLAQYLIITHFMMYFKDILPALKYCRGDIFSTQHWGELFRLLNLPDISVELLEFGHFLQAKSEIKRNVEALKVQFLF